MKEAARLKVQKVKAVHLFSFGHYSWQEPSLHKRDGSADCHMRVVLPDLTQSSLELLKARWKI